MPMYGTFPKDSPFHGRYAIIATEDPKLASEMFIDAFGPNNVACVFKPDDLKSRKGLARLCTVYREFDNAKTRTKHWSPV